MRVLVDSEDFSFWFEDAPPELGSEIRSLLRRMEPPTIFRMTSSPDTKRLEQRIGEVCDALLEQEFVAHGNFAVIEEDTDWAHCRLLLRRTERHTIIDVFATSQEPVVIVLRWDVASVELVMQYAQAITTGSWRLGNIEVRS